MPILDRYILREYIRIFFLSLCGLILVYLAIEFFEKIRSFVEHNASLINMLRYFLLKLPKIIFFISPPTLLISMLITFGILARNTEIVAMEGNGISVYRISTPLIIFSLVFSFLALYLNFTFIPVSNEKADNIKDVLTGGKPKGIYLKQDKIWFRGSDHSIFNIQLIDKDSSMHGVNIYRLDNKFSISEVIDAKELSYGKDGWVLSSGIRRRFLPDGAVEMLPFETLLINLNMKPDELRKIDLEPDNMTYSNLASYVQRLESGGYNPGRYKVSLYGKISFPFVNFIMALIGIAFGLRSNRAIGIAKSIGVSVVIGFFYWVVHSIGMSLGYASVVPPLLAAWMGNIIFLAIGGYLYLTMRM